MAGPAGALPGGALAGRSMGMSDEALVWENVLLACGLLDEADEAAVMERVGELPEPVSGSLRAAQARATRAWVGALAGWPEGGVADAGVLGAGVLGAARAQRASVVAAMYASDEAGGMADGAMADGVSGGRSVRHAGERDGHRRSSGGRRVVARGWRSMSIGLMAGMLLLLGGHVYILYELGEVGGRGGLLNGMRNQVNTAAALDVLFDERTTRVSLEATAEGRASGMESVEAVVLVNPRWERARLCVRGLREVSGQVYVVAEVDASGVAVRVVGEVVAGEGHVAEAVLEVSGESASASMPRLAVFMVPSGMVDLSGMKPLLTMA